MTLPDRGTFTEFGTLSNQAAGNAHAAVRDQVAFNGAAWESSTPYIHPCVTRGSNEALYNSVQDSTGQDPVGDVSNIYWAADIADTNMALEGTDSQSKMTPKTTKEVISSQTGQWENVTPDSGHVVLGEGFRVRKLTGGKRVSLQLNLSRPISVTSEILGKLPVGFEPDRALTFTSAIFSMDGDSKYYSGNVLINTSGYLIGKRIDQSGNAITAAGSIVTIRLVCTFDLQ